MRRNIASCLLLLALVGATAASADIYRWKDNNGQIHYTQTPPPPGNKDRGTVIRTTGPATGAQEQARERSSAIQQRLQSFRENRAKQRQEEEKQKADADRRARNCEAAKSNLAKLENRRQRRLLGKDGQVTVLTEAERQKRMEEARKQIRENCG
ncbi:MAG: hypothetical protein Kow006_15810 [Gammaproteobacteria bacterium]